MDNIGQNFSTKRRLDSRTRTMSENDSSYKEERVSATKWTLDGAQKQPMLSKDRDDVDDEDTDADSDGETFRELIRKHSERSKQRDDNVRVEPQRTGGNQHRPVLERKTRSDLTSYCYGNTKIKILVEGKEVPSKDTHKTYSSKEFNRSPQEPSINTDHVAEIQPEEAVHSKTKMRSFVGWFGKTHAQAYDLKHAEKNSKEASDKRSPVIKRSRSFSGRIRDKFKVSFTSTNAKQQEILQPPKSNYLQPPNIMYRNNGDWNRVYGVGVTQFSLLRRHSDQTDSMLRRPLGSYRRDAKTSPVYYSLDRGLLQMSSVKKPLTRKRSNSFEKEDDFPFWSQISDANRSHSCSARISVTEQLDTHRDNEGMLETNLCSTEL